MKRLSELLEQAGLKQKENGLLHFPIRRIVSDSRAVQKGDLFVALVGPNLDGHSFILEAIQSGAVAVIAQAGRLVPVNTSTQLPIIRVKDTSLAFGNLLAGFYELAKHPIRLIGVTGTNGKTTTAYLIHYLLNRLSSCGMIGTIQYTWKENKIKASNTTPGQAVLIPLLSQMARDEISYCVMEVSSHALDQARTAGINFEAAIFTNLTQDHLDYHKTFENYYQAKRKLFLNEPTPKYRIINVDDPYGKRLAKEISEGMVTYGISNVCDWRAEHVRVSLAGGRFELVADGVRRRVETKLPLYHNSYNILAALSAVSQMGFSLEKTIPLIQAFCGVPGRMQRVDEGQSFHVFVDYAHTPDAFQNVFSCVKQLAKGKIISVFGCGGNRDRVKRPLMGRIASESSEVIFLTDDNPRHEKSSDIIDEIERGIPPSSGAAIHRIPDRREAIREAIQLAQPEDLVLILGKGHESEQMAGDQVTHFDDSEIARESLRNLEKITH